MEKMESYTESAPNMAGRLSMALLLILLVYELFSTNIFLVQDVKSASDLTISSSLNQIVFGLLFIASSLMILYSLKDVLKLIRKEKYLFIYLFWCLLSVMWSDFKIVSIKRYLQLLTSYNVILVVFVFVRSDEDILRTLKWLMVVFVVASYLCIMFVPEATHDYGAWRGFRTHKTQLGMISMISSIVWAFSIRGRPFIIKWFSGIMLCLSVILMVGSRSLNSILCFGIFWVIILLIAVERHLRRFPTSYPLLPISIILVVSVLATGYYYYHDYMEYFLLKIGKDITFTGRTYLWEKMAEISKEHILIGAGYHGFWVFENPILVEMYRKFVWLPLQSHCGYIDILNEEGLIGMALFALMLAKMLQRIIKHQFYNIWTGFIAIILIWNFMESTLFRIRSVMGTFFFLSYAIVCYRSNIRKK